MNFPCGHFTALKLGYKACPLCAREHIKLKRITPQPRDPLLVARRLVERWEKQKAYREKQRAAYRPKWDRG